MDVSRGADGFQRAWDVARKKDPAAAKSAFWSVCVANMLYFPSGCLAGNMISGHGSIPTSKMCVRLLQELSMSHVGRCKL